MFKLKNEAWRREIRIWQKEQIKRTQRQRLLLLNDLSSRLSSLSHCEEKLDHHCFFDCENFAVEANRALFRIIASVGTEHCRADLLACDLPEVLATLTETIENKTVQLDEAIESKHFYSRERVLESITDLLCLLTEDQSLITRFGPYAVAMLVAGMRLRAPVATGESNWRNLLIGLLNLFIYEDFREGVYRQLREGNFQQLFRGYCMQLADSRLAAEEAEGSLFALFRAYVQYQREETQDQLHISLSPALEKLLHYFFMPDNRKYLDGFDQELLDELVKLLAYFTFSSETAILVLRCPQLTSFISYAQLLNAWTYHQHSAISISDFPEDEIVMLLAMENVKPNEREKYSECVAGALVNLLLNISEDQQAIAMIWRCLELTAAREEFCWREQEAFVGLRRLLNTYPPLHPI